MRIYYKIRNKLERLLFKPINPPSYEVKRETIKALKDDYKINLLVETGTFFGDTVEYFKTTFTKIISIELSIELANKAKIRFAKDDNITIINGDSGKVLKSLIKEINEDAIFWLDGHYSSEFYVNDEFIKTARTDVDTPIEEELNAILGSSINHIILIDDARLFNGLGDYPTISKIKKIIKRSNKPYSIVIENDMIKITPKMIT